MEPTRKDSANQSHDVTGGGSEPRSSISEPQVIVPPYWQHRRGDSYASVRSSIKPPPISLEDHIEEPSELSASLWAKGVSIDDYVMISGNVPGVRDYVVWTCKIDTLDVSDDCLRLDRFISMLYYQILLCLFVKSQATD